MSERTRGVGMGRVAGKIVLVTGAAQGIGAAIARLLAREGAQVLATDLDQARGQALALEAGIAFHPLDVTAEGDWRRAIARVEDEYGGLDILVNNAGIALVKPIEETTLEDFRRIMRVNVEGVFLGVKSAVPAMIERARATRAGGSIVNLSSVLGMRGIPDNVAYGTSKGAVRQLTKCAAVEFAQRGYNIRVNSVHPAITETPMVARELEEWSREGTLGTQSLSATRAAFAERLPLGRIGLPEEVAQMVLFLASDESSFSTGGEFAVDGGRLAV